MLKMNYELVETILYTGEEESKCVTLFVNPEDNSMWATIKIISEMFDVSQSTVSSHLKNIFEEGELDEDSSVGNLTTTAFDGKRYNTRLYNIDAIISLSYRINSKEAIDFRRWSIKRISNYLIKGIILDEEQLKNNGRFGDDYFPELIEKTREIIVGELF